MNLEYVKNSGKRFYLIGYPCIRKIGNDYYQENQLGLRPVNLETLPSHFLSSDQWMISEDDLYYLTKLEFLEEMQKLGAKE